MRPNRPTTNRHHDGPDPHPTQHLAAGSVTLPLGALMGVTAVVVGLDDLDLDGVVHSTFAAHD